MPRRLENDRWLFGVTLGLCLLGAVMIFSASAVTAEHEYGHSYFFLLRQSAWLAIGLAGMFVLMRTDYRKLREPAVVYSVLCIVGLMLVGAFFLDKSHATHRWIRFGPIGILGVVFGFEATQRRQHGISQGRFSAQYIARDRTDSGLCGVDSRAT